MIQDADVYRQLGALDAKVDQLLVGEEQAREARKQQYSKAENLERRLDDIDRKIATITSRMDKMEPVAAEVGKWRERLIGGLMLIGGVSALLGGIVAAAGKWLLLKLGLG